MTTDDYAAIRVALECFQSDCKSAVEYASKLYEGRDDLKNRIDREQFMLDHATAALTALEKYKPEDKK